MGRNVKVTAQEVLETLRENDCQMTAEELSEILDVCSATIRKRIRDLRKDGETIIHDKNGFLEINKESVKEEDAAKIAETFANWLLSIMKGVSICANPIRPLLPTMKKTLSLLYTSEERRILAKSCVKLKALCDHVEAEEDFEK